MGHHQLPPAYENHIIALGRVLQTLREEENADVLIETTLNYLQSEFEYRVIWIGLYDRMDHRLLGKGGITPNGNTNFLKQRFFLNPGDLLEQVVIQQKPVGIPDLREEVRAGEWRKAAQEFGIQGTLLFPLRCRDRCFGVVLLGSHLWGVSPHASEKAQLTLLFGGLANAFYQIEMEWQRSSSKRPDQALFRLIQEVQKLPTTEQRLDAVVSLTQEFVAATRTNVYWYNPEGRYFWHRVGNRQNSRSMGNTASTAGITVQEVNDFYYALSTNQLVTIGAGKSPLKAEVTRRLLSRLRTRSLLAAPILVQQQLVGFLAVEGNEARIWEESEKNFVRTSAQMIALVTGREEIETTLQQTQRYTDSIAEIASAIADRTDAQQSLEKCANLLLKQVGAERFLLLQPENTEPQQEYSPKNSFSYSVVYQYQPINRRPLTNSLSAMAENDRQLLFPEENQTHLHIEENFSTVLVSSAIAIENWEEDERLTKWREYLMPLGVRSLLVCRAGSAFNSGIVIIGHSASRTWQRTEQELVAVISQQIGQLLQALNRQKLGKLETDAHQALQTGLQTLLAAPPELAPFEREFTEFLARMLESPVTVMFNWSQRKPKAIVTNAVVVDPRFNPPETISISSSETLIQDAIATNHFLEYSTKDAPSGIRNWLSNIGIEHLLVISLHHPSNIPSGIFLLGYPTQNAWPSHMLPAIEILVEQFAHLRYHRRLNAAAINEARDLEHLNWYKHRCLETFHQTVTACVGRLRKLDTEDYQSQDLALLRMHSVQILHQMESYIDILRPLLSEEHWQLKSNLRAVPLANLLKRSLNNIESVTQNRSISINIHNPGNLNVYADRLKLECMLWELLLTACSRIQPGGRIDLWCQTESRVSEANENSESLAQNPSNYLKSVSKNARSNNQNSQSFVELLIADTGTIDPNLFAQKEANSNDDSNSLPINEPPTLNLKICQRILRMWGGDLLFYQLEENHFISRLLLPISN